jgi:acetyl-CoA carboxylase biotin carboxyl carrier protein
MTQNLDFLSDHEVRQITALVDTLDRSGFDYMQVDVGTIKVTIGKGSLPAPAVSTGLSAAGSSVPSPPPPAPVATTLTANPASSGGSTVPVASANSVPPDWLPITATTMGRFYSRPDPNSPPFVQVGASVGADDTVCLIEVMKLFNAITAGVAGTVMKVCVEDAAVVEFGQVLFYVKH